MSLEEKDWLSFIDLGGYFDSYISKIEVHEGFIGRGIGRKMIQFYLSYFFKNGILALYPDKRSSFDLVGWYRDMGFQSMGLGINQIMVWGKDWSKTLKAKK